MPSRDSFDTRVERRMESVSVSKSELNKLLMDYLVCEGYKDAAEKFAVEAEVDSPHVAASTMEDRRGIKSLIQRGEVEAAILRINELNPDLLENNGHLHFNLLRLQLIELIRTSLASPDNDFLPCVAFARDQLAPRAASNPDFVHPLQETMALMFFDPKDTECPQSLSALLDPRVRLATANEANEVLLMESGARKRSQIRQMLVMKILAEKWVKEDYLHTNSEPIDLGLDGPKLRYSSSNGSTAAGHTDAVDAMET